MKIASFGRPHVTDATLLAHARQPFSGWHLNRQRVVIGLLGVAVGLLIAANLQSKPRVPVTAEEYPRQVTAGTVERLEAEQADLKKTIADLRRMVAERQEQAAAAKSTLSGVNQQLEKQKLLAGMVALKGPGVRVVLDDTASKTIPAGDDPSLYIVHEYQLRDVVNLLWSARAEGIAVNNERLVTTSSIYCVGSTILVNNTRLSAPYEIVAIGDPQALDEAVTNANNLKSLKTRVKVYGLQFKVSKQREVTMPGFNGSLAIKSAVPTAR